MQACLLLNREPEDVTVGSSILRVSECQTKLEKGIAYFFSKVTKPEIWQIAYELELNGVIVGYGFGDSLSEAENNAIRTLERRVAAEDYNQS